MKTLLQTLFFFLLVTQIVFAQWVQVGLDNESIKDIAVQNSTIFAVALINGSVYRTLNGGTNWSLIVDSNAVNVAIAQPTGTLYLVNSDSLFSSSDSGNTWNRLNILEQLPPPSPEVLLVNVENISISNLGKMFCGLRLYFPPIGSSTAFALSFDEGLSWATPGWDILGGILFDFRDQYVITVGELHGGGAVGDDVYLSSDYGNTWSWLGSWPEPYPTLIGIYLNGNILYGCLPGTSGWEGGIFLSSDFCSSWTRISNVIPQAGLSVGAGGMLVGTESLGIFLFSDDGDSLGSFNDGLSNLNIHSLTIDNNNYVYAGTDNGLWRRPLSEITSVEENPMQIPSSYILSQNFPNPFNPNTTIKYSIPEMSKVSLTIFNMLGEEVITLVDEEKPAGTYEVTWYAEQLPSGVYFYQLKASSFIETRKMLLLK